jgi:hypothetical protein
MYALLMRSVLKVVVVENGKSVHLRKEFHLSLHDAGKDVRNVPK